MLLMYYNELMRLYEEYLNFQRKYIIYKNNFRDEFVCFLDIYYDQLIF